MCIVINTPTGHIGSRVVDRLLEAGAPVTVIHRNPEKIRGLADRGARVVEGPIDSQAVLDQALEGAEALFWLTPPADRPDFLTWAPEAARKAAETARSRGVRRVVVLSSMGAQNGQADPVGVLLAVENAFREAVPDVTVLRPGFFMENLLRSLDTLAQGELYHVFPHDRSTPLVSTRDIGDQAADALLDRSWSGHRIQGVHGPADLSQDDIVAVLSEELERPVRYTEISLEQFREGLRSAGVPPFLVDLFGDLYGNARRGLLDPAEPRTPETTTPTTLRSFVREVLRPALDRLAVAV